MIDKAEKNIQTMAVLNMLEFFKFAANKYGKDAKRLPENESEERDELLRKEAYYREEYKKLFGKAKTKLFKGHLKEVMPRVPKWAYEDDEDV